MLKASKAQSPHTTRPHASQHPSVPQRSLSHTLAHPNLSSRTLFGHQREYGQNSQLGARSGLQREQQQDAEQQWDGRLRTRHHQQQQQRRRQEDLQEGFLGRAKLVGSELPPHELAQVGKRVFHGTSVGFMRTQKSERLLR